MAVSTTPVGYHTLTTYLSVRNGVKAIEFYKTVFGAIEESRMAMPNGGLAHAELKIGDSHIMLADENPGWGNNSPETLGGTPVGLAIYVPDCDAVFAQAVAAGATVKKPVENQFYGDRSGTITDPFGHVWTISTHIEDVAPEEMENRFLAMMKQMAG